MNLRERRPRSSAGETQKSRRRVGPGWSLSGWDVLPEDRLWSGESGARVEVTGGCLWHVMTCFSDELLFLASAPAAVPVALACLPRWRAALALALAGAF